MPITAQKLEPGGLWEGGGGGFKLEYAEKIKLYRVESQKRHYSSQFFRTLLLKRNGPNTAELKVYGNFEVINPETRTVLKRNPAIIDDRGSA